MPEADNRMKRQTGRAAACGNGGVMESRWTGMTAICESLSHTLGLRSDGTVAACGSDHFGECRTGDWSGITDTLQWD